MHIAVRLWTSAATLGGREFCSILNQALREDNRERVTHASVVTHGVRVCVRIEASTLSAPSISFYLLLPPSTSFYLLLSPSISFYLAIRPSVSCG